MSLECSLVKHSNKNGTILCLNTGISIILDLKSFTLDLSPKSASKSALSELLKNGLSSLQKDKLIGLLLENESELYGNELKELKKKYPTPASIKAYFETRNIALSSNSLFGPSQKDVLVWLSDANSGYPDLAYKLIFLFEKGFIRFPDNKKINLTMLNGFYQKALSLPYDQPVKNHSIFIIKMIYEQLYQYYYGDK